MVRFTVIAVKDYEGMNKHLKNTLGSGGINVFPEYVGTCLCGVEICSNLELVHCPSCGTEIPIMKVGETFGK